MPAPSARRALAVAASLGVLWGVTGCGLVTSSAAPRGDGADGAATEAADRAFFDASQVHSIAVEFDEVDYDAMIETFSSTGEKEWIAATVTIDGTVIENVGIKLKGNSSLMGLRADGGAPGAGPGGSVSADEPEGLPWRIRLDKYVDGQNHLGETDIVVRGNTSETSLNEAVALDLLGEAGMATEAAIAVCFSVNGSDEELRLVIEMPDLAWYEATFEGEGVLFKSEAEGDWSYRGDDPDEYTEAFDIEATTSGEEDWTPLVDFLRFLDESDDATIATELDEWLDVEAFAEYLAMMDLIANADDIDGPGNNSYLQWDSEAGIFTVVAWDQNLAFGGLGGGGAAGFRGQDGMPERGAPPEGMTPPEGITPPGLVAPSNGARPDAARGGAMSGNVLAERFRANEEFAALIEAAAAELEAELIDSGAAQDILDRWTAVLTAQATDLVDEATITAESARIAEYLTAS